MSSELAASGLSQKANSKNRNRWRIGVFDSGLGANHVANRLKQRFPGAETVVRTGSAQMPYGQKTPKQIWRLIEPIIVQFGADNLDGLIIACNTVATNLLGLIQKQVEVPVVGFEPPLATALAVSEKKRVLVCATRATLKSQSYRDRRRQIGDEVEVIERSYRHWAAAIEAGRFRPDWLKKLVDEAIAADVDCIVLGCTHYHWLAPACRRLTGPAVAVIEPTDNVIDDLFERLELPSQIAGPGRSSS